MSIRVGYGNFLEEASAHRDKIVIYDCNDTDAEAKLKIEYLVRVPQDPRGFKHVVTKTGTWTSSTPAGSARHYETATTLNFDGETTASVTLTRDDQNRLTFNFNGKNFICVNGN